MGGIDYGVIKMAVNRKRLILKELKRSSIKDFLRIVFLPCIFFFMATVSKELNAQGLVGSEGTQKIDVETCFFDLKSETNEQNQCTNEDNEEEWQIFSFARRLKSNVYNLMARLRGSPQKINLQKRGYTINDLLKIMRTTPIGSELVSQFKPLMDSGEIQVKPITDEVLRDHNAPKNVQAMFSYKNRKKIIYIAYEKPLGAVLTEFAHEISHSLDEDTLARLSKLKSKKIPDQITYDSETNAYTVGTMFAQEMNAMVKCNSNCRNSCYTDFLSQMVKDRLAAPFSMSPSGIIKNYKLSCDQLQVEACDKTQSIKN